MRLGLNDFNDIETALTSLCNESLTLQGASCINFSDNIEAYRIE